MITNIGKTPFDETMARYISEVLRRETGKPYNIIPFMDGYAIEVVLVPVEEKQNSFEEIYLRPAIQSQVWNMLLLVGTLIVYLNIETTLLTVGLDQLQTMIYQLLSRTFPWDMTVAYAGKLILFFVVLLAWTIFYNLVSRKYMIGPKGVEASIGLFNKDEPRVEYAHIRGVRAKRSILQRLLFYGDILIATSGTAEAGDVTFKNIALPTKYKKILKERML
jgi:hypothetical protein